MGLETALTGALTTERIRSAMQGGPYSEPPCYEEIGGLATETLITLPLVPVLRSIFVRI